MNTRTGKRAQIRKPSGLPQSPTARMSRVSFFVSAEKCISAMFRCHPTRLGERTGRRSWKRGVSLLLSEKGSKRVAILPM